MIVCWREMLYGGWEGKVNKIRSSSFVEEIKTWYLKGGKPVSKSIPFFRSLLLFIINIYSHTTSRRGLLTEYIITERHQWSNRFICTDSDDQNTIINSHFEMPNIFLYFFPLFPAANLTSKFSGWRETLKRWTSSNDCCSILNCHRHCRAWQILWDSKWLPYDQWPGLCEKFTPPRLTLQSISTMVKISSN